MMKIDSEILMKTRFHQAMSNLLKNKEYHHASPSRRLEMFKKELEKFDNKKNQTVYRDYL